MPEVTSYTPGTPAWADLTSSDPEGARAFYGDLFGWEFEIGPEETGYYASAQLRGRNVVGVNGMPAQEGMPTAWLTYLATDDSDTTAKRVTDQGGTVMMGPLDIMGQGRMLLATDPTGAVFGTWEAQAHIGSAVVNEPGAISWNELATRDLPAAAAFYSGLFGYEWESVDTGAGGPTYQTFAVGGREVGGALEMTAEWPAEIPPHWMPYFGVADTDATAARATELGGQVPVGPHDSPYGRFAVVTDPQGGHFTIIAMGEGQLSV